MTKRPFTSLITRLALTFIPLCLIYSSLFANTGLDPKGRIHIPIGIPNTVDTLKTFAEPEGCFSPGFATYGIYFWIYDKKSERLYAPTMDDVPCEYDLGDSGSLTPHFRWRAGDIIVEQSVFQAETASPDGPLQIVGVSFYLTNTSSEEIPIAFYAALRPSGPAGGPVRSLSASERGNALLVDGHVAIVALGRQSAGVLSTDTIGDYAVRGALPAEKTAVSESGDCSGTLFLELEMSPKRKGGFGFLCPVLAGRRAVGHNWDGKSTWAQLDLAEPNPSDGGTLQPDPPLAYYRGLSFPKLFNGATEYWNHLLKNVDLTLPDPNWTGCFRAIIAHAAMSMNEGAPDVVVVNYNVFNRDGVYVANILQKSGNIELAEAAIDYFLAHPFNGRTEVEADNPGQILWVMGEHWRFTKDNKWLDRVYPPAAKIAAMIEYYRTTPGPHYVKATSLEFGDNLPADKPDDKPAHKRQILSPGSCDGFHPEYTEAFDIAGLRAAATLAEAAGKPQDAKRWSTLAETLMKTYDETFGDRLPNRYGNYSVLWPCRLYPFTTGKAFEQFRKNGETSPGGWRYFALAKAHQGLLAGNREAGYKTIANHLEHEQMQGWYAFDEGGKSGPGGWRFARTTWNPSVAMPHGWANAEMWLLLRDSIAFEDGDSLRLLQGIPPEWFKPDDMWKIEYLPTYFGQLTLIYYPKDDGALLVIGGTVRPEKGFILALPESLEARIFADEEELPRQSDGSVVVPTLGPPLRLRW